MLACNTSRSLMRKSDKQKLMRRPYDSGALRPTLRDELGGAKTPKHVHNRAMSIADEQVLVLPARVLHELGA